jgi:DNA-binding winged helix-turn-helix (wHTH) protein
MHDEPEPTFAKQLQDAVERGQVVIVPAPHRSPGRPRTSAAPLPRNRSKASLTAAFCLTFKLTRAESHTLLQLLVRDYNSKEDLCVAESAFLGRTVSDNTVQTIICALRKKLKPHKIGITTLPGLGYGLDKDARYRIRALLARYDTGFRIHKRPRKPKAIKPNLFPDACA